VSMDVTDPASAAENDAQAALHLPGASKGWARRPVRLPASTEDRADWLRAYADWLSQAAGTANPGC